MKSSSSNIIPENNTDQEEVKQPDEELEEHADNAFMETIGLSNIQSRQRRNAISDTDEQIIRTSKYRLNMKYYIFGRIFKWNINGNNAVQSLASICR